MVDQLSARRVVLPIPDRQHLGLVTYDAKDPDTSFPPIEPVLPPEGAPNVLVVLLDDVGFGAASAFGGPAQTPTAERGVVPSGGGAVGKRRTVGPGAG
jgi:arylsulfatase